MSRLCSKKRRGCKGTALAEMPVTMYLIFFGLLMPLMAFATFGYRVSMAYFAVRDACYYAAKSSTYSNAVTNAQVTWARDVAAWHGFAGTEQISIFAQPIAGGPGQSYSAPLTQAQLNTTNYVYFIRLQAQCQIQPFFPSASGWIGGIQVPGFTTAYPLTMAIDHYVENTSGLTQ